MAEKRGVEPASVHGREVNSLPELHLLEAINRREVNNVCISHSYRTRDESRADYGIRISITRPFLAISANMTWGMLHRGTRLRRKRLVLP